MDKKYISGPDIARLCRSLSLLLHAGIGLGDGLFLQAEEEEEDLRQVLEKMGQAVDQGVMLSDAMEENDRFPGYVSGMVKVGEHTGRLEEALLALADYYDEQDRMNRQVRYALTYPSVLLLMMLVVIGVLLIRVLPVFDDVYASLGGHLTGLAGGLLRMGQILEAALPLFGVLLAAAAVLLLVFAANESFRGRVLSFWRKKWGDRGISKKINDAHFAQALAMGLKSGLMLEEAVELAGSLLKDIPEAAERCRLCAEGLAQGESLTQVLRRTQVMPVSCCRMLELGMRGGSGDEVMEEIAARLSEEASQALEQKVAQVEPAMVMSASLLVGMILLAVMLPLLNIMSAIG